ncbi:autotransporter assembly complex protein TamB [Motilimonas eburnea]|uniref:autotransporter assembly complex protein TamB n=1 Tax=Motilimonas eburnea TaxID=1737488 RepID=UPI001E46570D|nr:translocation/assembly module TamB domain-containing protein [Motilimonas eburnea]MCE2570068.1 translocation/assembly module TamB [Motilimonas eburnea]
MMIWLRRILLGLLLLISLVIALIFSHHGNVLLLHVAKQLVPQLEIELEQGTLLFSPHLTGVAWQDEQLDLVIDELNYRIDWGCLTKAFCLNSLVVNGVDVNFHPTEQTEPEPSEPFVMPTSLSIPIEVRLQGIDIQNVAYRQEGLDVTLKHLLLSAQISQQEASIAPVIDGVVVKLATPSDAQPTSDNEDANPVDDPVDDAVGDAAKDIAKDTPFTLPELRTPIPVSVPQLSLSHIEVIQGEQRFVLNSFYTQASWSEHDLTLSELSLVIPELSATLDAQVSMVQQWPLQLTLFTKIKQDPVLEGDLVGQTVYLSLSGDSEKLDAQLDLVGPVDLALKGWMAPLDPKLQHQLKLSWPKLQWPLQGEAQYTLSKGALNLAGDLDDFALALDTLAAGEGLPDVALSSQVNGNLTQLNVTKLEAKTLSGIAQLTGQLTLAEQLSWQGKLDVKDIDTTSLAPDYPAQLNGVIEHQFALQGEQWQIKLKQLDLSGQFMEQPLTVKGQAAGNSQMQWDITQLSLVNGNNSLHAKGRVEQQLALNLELDFPDISSSVPDVAGAVVGKLNVTGPLASPKVNVNLSAKGIAYQALTIDALALNGDLVASKQPNGQINLTIADVQQGDMKFDSIKLDAQGGAANHRATLAVVGEPVNAEITLAGTWVEQGWQGQLEQAWFNTIEGRWQLQQASKLAYLKNQLRLERQCWQSAPSEFCINPSRIGEAGESGLTITHYDLTRLQHLLPSQMALTGALSADLSAKWANGEMPIGRLNLAGDKIKLEATDEDNQVHQLPIDVLTLQAELGKTLANVNLLLDTADLGKAEADVSVQPYHQDRAIQGKIRYQGLELQALHYLLPDIEEMAGKFDLDVNLSGPLLEPVIKGDAKLVDGKLGGGSLPIWMSDINTEIKLNGTQATLTGELNTGDGDAKIEGELDWTQGVDAWVTLKGDNIEIDHQSQVQLFVSPDIKFTLDDAKMDLSGQVLVPKGLIVVKSLPPSAVSVSDDVVVIDSSEAETDGSELPMKMKLRLLLGDDVKIDAFGLKSNLEGQLAVTKKVDGPMLVNGEIRLEDGSYRAFGQNLLINKGLILFSGSPDQPYLSVDAIRDPNLIEDKVTAGIKLEGPVSAPEIEIYSDPSMDQQNALSYLLRGKAIDSNGGDSSMLTSVLINLGVGQSAGTVNQIGEAIGVKDLSLDSSGSGDDSQLNISGYILPGVQIRYGIGLFTAMSEIALRYEVMPKLYLEAVSGLNNAFDVYYEFDWD